MTHLLKHIILILPFFAATIVSAQGNKVEVPSKTSATVNQYDGKGLPHGVWVNAQPEKMGEPAFMEFGKYDHGNKSGAWYKLDNAGEMIAMETFRNNVLDGEVKYFYRNQLTSTGYYRGLNPEREFDTIVVEDPITGLESLKPVHNDNYTVRHGQWRFYDYETGRLVREEEYQVDSLIYSKEFPMSTADSVYYKKREAGMPHNKKKPLLKKAARSSEYIK